MDSKNYYEILNVNVNANESEIKKAYHVKAKQLHPDKNGIMESTEKFKELQQAYGILSRAETRSLYDKELAEFTHVNILSKEIFIFVPASDRSTLVNFSIGFFRGTLGIIMGMSLIGLGVTTGLTMVSGGSLLFQGCCYSFFQPHFGILPTISLMIPADYLLFKAAFYLANNSVWTGSEIIKIGITSNVKSMSYLFREIFITCTNYLKSNEDSEMSEQQSIRIEDEEWILMED